MAGKREVFYFYRLTNADVFQTVLDGAGVTLTRLEYDMPVATIDAALARARIYQIHPESNLARQNGYEGGAALIARCPNLLAISLPGSGYDVVEMAACTAAGVLVVNQAGLHAEGVAEHALGMMIGLSKQIIQAHTALHGPRDWRRLDFAGRDIAGKTLGIVGFGAIGQRLAAICRGAFGMRIVTHHPRLAAAEIRTQGAEPMGFDALLEEADFIVAALPLTDQTRGLFGAAEFARMKETAYFITVSRGGVHDEAALAEALTAGSVAGAGIDVWEVEPPPSDHPLLAFPNVMATPHIAAMTFDGWNRVARGAAEQLVGILDGHRPPRLLNPDAWPRYVERYERITGTPIEETPET